MNTTGPDATARAMRIDGPLSARVVLDHFNERGRPLLGAGQADAAGRIAQLLAHEADLSARWQGLPGTDHPRHWQADAGDEAALSDERSRHRRLDVHLPLWWALPLAVRDRRPQRVALPLAADRAQLAALVERHLPGAWRAATVQVTLDIETRVYWGARGAVHPRAAARHACAQRGDAGRPALKLATLVAGHALATTLPDHPVDPDVVLTVHPGVGWMVALPVLRFERQPSGGERLQLACGRWWRRLRSRLGHPLPRDRDPTFAARLAADEAWWARQLAIRPADAAVLERERRLGAALRPASLPATRAPAERMRAAQAIVIHGGLSSARSAFEAALDTPARAASGVAATGAGARAAAGGSVAGEPAAAATGSGSGAGAGASFDLPRRVDDPAPPPGAGQVWPGLPALDERATWRFEHDTFLGISRNVAHLVAAVGRQCVANPPPGATRHIVLIAHSRGGNVARFGLQALRRAYGKQGWTFAAVTLGSPHLGTRVFERVGHRWYGLAAAVGGLRHLCAPWLSRELLAQLVNLERGLAYDVPPGFHDVEPEGVQRMMRGRSPTELPPGMWLVGSRWGPGPVQSIYARTWDWLFEDVLGAEEESDGLVRRASALAGRAADAAASAAAACPMLFDASPVFHTQYLAHEPTRAQIARMLTGALADGGAPAVS